MKIFLFFIVLIIVLCNSYIDKKTYDKNGISCITDADTLSIIIDSTEYKYHGSAWLEVKKGINND